MSLNYLCLPTEITTDVLWSVWSPFHILFQRSTYLWASRTHWSQDGSTGK